MSWAGVAILSKSRLTYDPGSLAGLAGALRRLHRFMKREEVSRLGTALLKPTGSRTARDSPSDVATDTNSMVSAQICAASKIPKQRVRKELLFSGSHKIESSHQRALRTTSPPYHAYRRDKQCFIIMRGKQADRWSLAQYSRATSRNRGGAPSATVVIHARLMNKLTAPMAAAWSGVRYRACMLSSFVVGIE